MRKLFLIGLSCLSLLLAAQSQVPKKETRVVVMVDREKGATVYRVNSAPASLPGLLDTLANAFDSKAPDRPVFVLVHEDTPLRVVADLREMLGKVGFDRVSYYYFGRSKRSMQELRFGLKVLTFSESGPLGGD